MKDEAVSGFVLFFYDVSRGRRKEACSSLRDVLRMVKRGMERSFKGVIDVGR